MPDRIGNGNLLQCCTSVEHSGADFRDALRQSNTSQGIALIKRLLADLLYSIRNIHTLQLLALKNAFAPIFAAVLAVAVPANFGSLRMHKHLAKSRNPAAVQIEWSCHSQM